MEEREPASVAATLPGVVAVLDTEDDRVIDQAGLPSSDPLEIVLHFTGTWAELLQALLPVLSDALAAVWTPPRWWACSGGDHVALGREGRAVVVQRGQEGPFLVALAGDGRIEGVRVW